MTTPNATAQKPTVRDDIDREIDDEEVDDGLDEVKNVSGERVEFIMEGRRVKLKPGQKTRIKKAYARPRPGATPDGDKLPPQIIMLTGGRVQPTNPNLKMEVDSRLGTVI